MGPCAHCLQISIQAPQTACKGGGCAPRVATRRARRARRPQAFGLRECALGGGGGGPRVPAWLEKWAALALEFVAEEQRLLPEQLLALPLALGTYTPASARAEAKGAPPRPNAAP